MQTDNVNRRTFTFEGRTYEIILPNVFDSLDLCTEFSVHIAPHMAGLIGALGGQVGAGLDMAALMAAMIQGLQGLSRINPQKANELLLTAARLGKLSCDRKEISGKAEFELYFGQVENRKAIYPVCAWALWEGVRDFFPKWGDFISRIGSMNLKGATESPSPKTGPGTIG